MAKRTLDIDSLPSNNIDPVEKDIVPVTTGRIKTRRAKGGLASDIRNVGNSLFGSIVLPEIKTLILDFFYNGLEMMMFRESDSPVRRGKHRAYNAMYSTKSRRSSLNRRGAVGTRTVDRTHAVYEDIFFENRGDAQEVLGRMMELVAEYGWATIGDLHSLVGLSSNYTHERYGWDDLRRCRVQRTTDGYLINFPEPDYLE